MGKLPRAHRDQCPIECVRVGIDRHLQPQALAAAGFTIDSVHAAVEGLKRGFPSGGFVPHQPDDTLPESRIRVGLESLNNRECGVAGHAQLQRVTEASRIILHLRELVEVNRLKREYQGVVGTLNVGIRHAPSMLVPVAQFHPANVASAGFAVLGQPLIGPSTAPVLEPDLIRLRRGSAKMNLHPMNLPRVFPHQPATYGEGKRKRGDIHRRRRDRRRQQYGGEWEPNQPKFSGATHGAERVNKPDGATNLQTKPASSRIGLHPFSICDPAKDWIQNQLAVTWGGDFIPTTVADMVELADTLL